MSKTNLPRNINPALVTEMLTDQGLTACWYRDGRGENYVVTDAPHVGIVTISLGGR